MSKVFLTVAILTLLLAAVGVHGFTATQTQQEGLIVQTGTSFTGPVFGGAPLVEGTLTSTSYTVSSSDGCAADSCYYGSVIVGDYLYRTSSCRKTA